MDYQWGNPGEKSQNKKRVFRGKEKGEKLWARPADLEKTGDRIRFYPGGRKWRTLRKKNCRYRETPRKKRIPTNGLDLRRCEPAVEWT